MSFAVVNAKYNDPKSNAFDTRNVLVQGGKITGVGYIPDEDEESLTVVDATKSVLIPSVTDFVYMPHPEQLSLALESIFSAGIQKVVFLPNVGVHSIDQPDDLDQLISNLPNNYKDDICFVASATLANQSDQLSELSLLSKAGASAIYFDRIIENESLLIEALQYMSVIDCPIIFGPMTTMAQTRSHLNDGATSFKIGVKGESISVEDQNVLNILSLLDQYYNGPVHFQVLSSAASIKAIHEFRQKKNQEITIGACPFHFEFNETVLDNYHSQCKFNPPFRSSTNQEALNLMMKEGIIDHFTSLHLPATGDIYAKSFFDQPFGTSTVQDFLNLASHLLIKHDISLGDFSSYFHLPKQFHSVLNQSTIDIHQLANFTILRASKEFQDNRCLLNALDINCYGGLVGSVKNGTLYSV